MKNTRIYQSPDAFLEDVTIPEIWKTGECASQKKEKDRSGWHGSEDFEDMISLMRGELDTAICEKVTEKLQRVAPAIIETTRYDVVGSFVDVGAFMSGEPECMVDFVEEDSRGKYATFVFNQCESAKISAENIMAKTAAATALIDALENQGVRCCVWLLIASDNYEYNIEDYAFIKLKDFSDSVSVNQLTALHVSFFRRAWFSYQEKYYPKHTTLASGNSGYGRVISDFNNKDRMQYIADAIGADENLFINNSISKDDKLEKMCNDINSDNYESLQNWINGFINEINSNK